MKRVMMLAVVLAMLSGCMSLPRNVAQELEPVQHDHPDHFQKP